jgi:HEAT repeats
MKRTQTRSSAALPYLLLALILLATGTLALRPDGVADPARDREARRESTGAPTIAAAPETRHDMGTATIVRRPAYHAPVGSRMTYRFSIHTAWTLDAEATMDGADDVVVQPTSKALEQAMTTRGQLTLTVAARQGDELIVRLDFANCRIEIPRGERSLGLQRLQRALAKPTHVRMRDTGFVLGYRFADGLVASQRDLIRSIVTSFHVAVPDPTVVQWEAEATDNAGRYRADYELLQTAPTSFTVTRTKLRYTATATPDTPLPGCEGTCHAVFGRELGWLTGVKFDEKLVQSMQGLGGRFSVNARGELHLKNAERPAPATLADVSFDGEWAGLTASPARIAAEAEADELSSWQRILKDVSFDQLLAELQRLIADKSADTPDAQSVVEALSWLLRTRADVVAEVEAAIRGAEAGGDLDGMLMWALTKAGTPATQDVLAGFLADVAAPARRQSATVAMTQLAEPGEAVMGVLTHQVMSASGTGPGDRMALLLMGTLAPRAKKNEAKATSPLQTLLAQEKSAIARGLLPTWLEALGNAATAAIVPRVIPYLGHKSGRVRHSAASALRDVHTPTARTALLRSAKRDPDAAVRINALRSLRGHELHSVRGTLHSIAKDDRSPDARRLAVVLLASTPRDRQTTALLQHVAKHDNEQGMRELAQRLLRQN